MADTETKIKKPRLNSNDVFNLGVAYTKGGMPACMAAFPKFSEEELHKRLVAAGAIVKEQPVSLDQLDMNKCIEAADELVHHVTSLFSDHPTKVEMAKKYTLGHLASKIKTNAPRGRKPKIAA